ncbi:MAG: hypothetical protein ACRD3N_03875 [Terracidiphilus sp.]
MSDSDKLLVFNGINGATGRYDFPPMAVADFSLIASGTAPRTPEEKAHLDELKRRFQRDTQTDFAPKEGVDPKNLSETGWGAIFAFGFDPAIREALSPLLNLRKQQAGGKYREYTGPDAYRPASADGPGESKQDFLSRHGAGPGPVDPQIVPYYLLIVGDPDTIPFRFQYQLDVQYAVGRIHFDTVAEYAAYAQSVVAAETGSLALAPRAAFFATANDGDAATKLSHDELAAPLAEWAATPPNLPPGWTIDKFLNGDASKARLAGLLHSDAPAFLFTASHGLCYQSGDPRQRANQGALLCQDWPGPSYQQAIPDSFFFAGSDIADDAHVFGTITMHFACFGAGTPHLSDFSSNGPPPAIAPHGFLGCLPQRLIAHPRGGALAVIGHVERAWQYSFDWDRAGSQTEVFKSTIKRLIEGHPVGSAIEYFNGRYAELSSDLSDALQDVKFGATVDPYFIAGLWTANNDARNYSIVGDPAVRLMLAGDSRPFSRPDFEVHTVSTAPAAPPTPPAATAAPAAHPLAADYGILDSVRAAASSLQDAAQKICAWLAESFETVTSVRVSTYASDDIAQVKFENGAFTGARLRATTVASLDGNTVVCVPEENGQVDDVLWKIHSDALEKALANRVEMFKAAAEAIGSLVPGVKLQ